MFASHAPVANAGHLPEIEAFQAFTSRQRTHPRVSKCRARAKAACEGFQERAAACKALDSLICHAPVVPETVSLERVEQRAVCSDGVDQDERVSGQRAQVQGAKRAARRCKCGEEVRSKRAHVIVLAIDAITR